MANYAKPEVLVDTECVASHAGDPAVRILKSDEDVYLYDVGHVPGALKVDWHADLNNPRIRDYIDDEGFAQLMERLGIGPDTMVVFYGDKSNWWACYAYWVFRLLGHEHLRIMNGGRAKWIQERRPLEKSIPGYSPSRYVLGPYNRHVRALREEVLDLLGRPEARFQDYKLPEGRALVDVRSPGEFVGELLHMADYPQEGALRAGHIPGAANVPWGLAVKEDGTFKSADELASLYASHGVTPEKEVIVYCRIGERSSLTWFVLTELLGYTRVKNYDGSWTEWGNVVGLPIENPSLGKKAHVA